MAIVGTTLNTAETPILSVQLYFPLFFSRFPKLPIKFMTTVRRKKNNKSNSFFYLLFVFFLFICFFVFSFLFVFCFFLFICFPFYFIKVSILKSSLIFVFKYCIDKRDIAVQHYAFLNSLNNRYIVRVHILKKSYFLVKIVLNRSDILFVAHVFSLQ